MKMKALTEFTKNIKLLFRSKESAYTIIFGPILIILLVSFAFLGADNDYTIRVGVNAPETEYASRALEVLQQNDYLLSMYEDQGACTESVKSGVNHACIVFGEGEIGEGTIPVSFYLDMSRTNVVYKVAEDIASALEIESSEIRAQLAGDALTRMDVVADSLSDDLEKAEAVQKNLEDIANDLQGARKELDKLANTSINTTDAKALSGYHLGLRQNARNIVNISMNAFDDSWVLITRLERDCGNCSENVDERVAELRNDLKEAELKMLHISEDVAEKQLLEASLLLDNTIDDIEDLQRVLQNDSAARKNISAYIKAAHNDAAVNEENVKQIIANIKLSGEVLKGQTVDASSISTPVAVSVVSVTVEDDQLTFTYPYLLVLVIMFMGMMLASTLVVVDRMSKATFRNFTTPTSDTYHIIIAFVTAFLLLVAEVAVLLLLSSIFVVQPLLSNFGTTIILICIAVILFTFLGMIIGYLARTQEAAMIASISIGSILLFVSNIIVPIEGMAGIVQILTQFNPYLILSELLKKSMLHGILLKEVSTDLLVLFVLCIILLVITVIIQRRLKQNYFRQDRILAEHIPAPLVLGEKTIHNEVELLDALDHMTRAEFEALVKADNNLIFEWAEKELRNKSLARKLRTTSKERMILRLDDHLAKYGRNITRKD